MFKHVALHVHQNADVHSIMWQLLQYGLHHIRTNDKNILIWCYYFAPPVGVQSK